MQRTLIGTSLLAGVLGLCVLIAVVGRNDPNPPVFQTAADLEARIDDPPGPQVNLSNLDAMYSLTWERRPQLCDHEGDPSSFACSPRGYSFIDNHTLRFFSRNEACDVLHRAGIQSIHFVGDSYVRQTYQGFLLALSTDYNHAATTSRHDECKGEGQFYKICRDFVPWTDLKCEGLGRVTLSCDYNDWPMISSSRHTNFDLVVWGVGNHRLQKGSRFGINDADVVIRNRLHGLCKGDDDLSHRWMRRRYHGNSKPRIYWLLPHVRYRPTKPDESRKQMDDYSNRTSQYLLEHCHIPSIDVRYMTGRMVDTLSKEELKAMKLDVAHWLRVVNVIKGQIILNQIAHDFP